MLFVDPESGAKLPRGIMNMRVKLNLPEPSYLQGLLSTWPAALPLRQTVLVAVDHVHKLLQLIPMVEYEYSMRLLPGNEYESVDGMLVIARRGVDGFSLLVHVHSDR
jgi:hypothetical protein